MHPSFPTEIWSEISNLSSPQSLSQLCLTSSTLLAIARPILFREVRLASLRGYMNPYPSVEATFHLLSNNLELARYVRSLTLVVYAAPGPIDNVDRTINLFNFDMFSKLVSLKRLTIAGPLFLNVDDQLQFGSILAQNSLEEFTYEGALGCEWWPGASLGSLSQLKSIWWKASENCDTPIEDRLSPMWDLLTSSRLTLTTISLPFGVSEEDVNDQLWAMHFPSLLSLKLGLWEFDSTRAATGFTSFVLSHSTLEELDLDYGNYDDYALSFDESSLESLTAQSLPNLRTLRCNTHCLAVLLRAKVQSLCALSSLNTGPGGVDDPTLAMDSLYRALSTFPNALSNLKELKLDFSQWEETERDDILDSIRRLSKYCGHKLETWHNGLPARVQFSASRLRSIFRPFHQLRSIHLASRLILNNSQHNDISVESSILELALCCHNLEEIHLESPGLKGEADGVWLIERGKAGSHVMNVHRRIVF